MVAIVKAGGIDRTTSGAEGFGCGADFNQREIFLCSPGERERDSPQHDRDGFNAAGEFLKERRVESLVAFDTIVLRAIVECAVFFTESLKLRLLRPRREGARPWLSVSLSTEAHQCSEEDLMTRPH